MGFYIRKSVSVGPLRFNLSSSGIGVSAGVKGFRVGTGPHGNYVHMGRGGIYFRQSLPNFGDKKFPTETNRESSSNLEFKEVDSGDVSLMVDSSSADLLEEISDKSQKIQIWPFILGAGVFLLAVSALGDAPVWVYFLLVPVLIGSIFWAVRYDKIRKTVILSYHLEPHIEEAYQNLHDVFSVVKGCSRMWHIESGANVRTLYDWKVNSGASTVVRRKGIFPHVSPPAYFQCNLIIPALPAGRQTLYFLPDRILVWDTNKVGAVNYEQLNVNYEESRFIENGGVPSDSRTAGQTWRYVNKSGGPDRRFNNNYQIPICLYEALLLTSTNGVRELFQLSRTGVGVQFNAALNRMASAIALREQPKIEDGSSDEIYIKCPCNNCDIMIEFPEHGVGQTIVCPHCGLETVLFQPHA